MFSSLDEDEALAHGSDRCRTCRTAPPAFIAAVAYGTYEGTLRALIHLLKYEGVEAAARPLGGLLAKAILSLPAHAPKELWVVGVPLHAQRERSRGFNQSELLGREAMRMMVRRSGQGDGAEQVQLHAAFGALARRRMTDSQSNLTQRQRRLNLRGAFAVVRDEAVRGRDILLLDDIYTSGATARECSKVLLKAGAASVWVTTLARSQREGVAMWDAAGFTSAVRTGVQQGTSL